MNLNFTIFEGFNVSTTYKKLKELQGQGELNTRIAVENLVAARLNYEIAMERYMLGDLSGIEMREAQKSLLNAEERLLTASYNTKLCEISLLQISGQVQAYLQL